MNQLRNFIVGSAGAIGLMEFSGDATLLSPDDDPQTLAVKAVVTVVAGLTTTLLSRLLAKRKAARIKKKRPRCFKRIDPESFKDYEPKS